MHRDRHLLVLLFALVLAWLAVPVTAAAAHLSSNTATAYTYDNQAHSAQLTRATSERGPPATHVRATTCAAADHRSDGTSARPSGPATASADEYDVAAPPEQVDRIPSMTAGHAQAISGDVSSLQRSRVAADTAGDVGASSAARGGVYSLRDEAGNVVRTCRTNNLAARETAHANDPVLGDYQFNVEYRTDVYAEQCGLEQVLYDRYPGAQAANGGLNKIRGISPTNPNLDFYMQSAWNFLGGG